MSTRTPPRCLGRDPAVHQPPRGAGGAAPGSHHSQTPRERKAPTGSSRAEGSHSPAEPAGSQQSPAPGQARSQAAGPRGSAELGVTTKARCPCSPGGGGEASGAGRGATLRSAAPALPGPAGSGSPGRPPAGALGPRRGARKVGRPGSGAGWEAAQANGKRRA